MLTTPVNIQSSGEHVTEGRIAILVMKEFITLGHGSDVNADMYLLGIVLQICKCKIFEFARVVFSSGRHCYFADDSIGVVSKIAMPLFTFWQRCVMI